MSHVIAPKILMLHSSCACDCSFWRNWKPRHKKGIFKQQEGIPVPINNICDLNWDWERFFENLGFGLRSILHNSGTNIEMLNLRMSSFSRFQTILIRIFLRLESNGFPGIFWDLIKKPGLSTPLPTPGFNQPKGANSWFVRPIKFY